MNYPLIYEYIDSIKAAEDNFDQLKHLRPVLDVWWPANNVWWQFCCCFQVER